MFRSWTSLAHFVAFCLVATPAIAQATASGAPASGPPGVDPADASAAPSSATTSAEHQAALRVVVHADQAKLDGYRVQQAIERELGVVVRGDDQPGVVGTLTVTATGPDALEMAYQGKDGRRGMRTVSLPADIEHRIDTVALVAGNLVRDETGELIEALRPALKPAEPSASESSPVELTPAVAEKPVPVAPPPSAGREPSGAESPNVSGEVPDLPSRPLNLTLFHPLAIYPNSETLEFNAELALVYSDVGRVTGASVSALVGRLRYGFTGAQVSGLVNVISGRSRGLSVAGAFGYHRGDLDGALVGGAVTWAKGDLTGADLAGVLAFRDGHAAGAQIGGAVAITSLVDGALVGGALTLTNEITGFQLAGAMNGVERAQGVMLAGALNLASERATGVQLSTVNVARSLRGLQLGIINVAGEARGAQVGIINIAKKVDGASVGLIPVAGNGSQHLVLWTTPGVALGNIGAKFRVGPFYSLLGFGYEPDADGPDHALPAAGLGAQWDISRVYLACDGLVQSSFKASDFDQNETLVSLRPQLGVKLQSWLAIFGGLAVVSGPHDDQWSDQLKVRALAGVELF